MKLVVVIDLWMVHALDLQFVYKLKLGLRPTLHNSQQLGAKYRQHIHVSLVCNFQSHRKPCL